MKKLFFIILASLMLMSSTAYAGNSGTVKVDFDREPISVYIKKELHKIGSRCETSFHVIIDENEAGAFNENTELSFSIEPMQFGYFDVRRVIGDIEVNTSLAEGKVKIKSISESSEASSLKVDLNVVGTDSADLGEYDIMLMLTDTKNGVIEEKKAENCLILYNSADYESINIKSSIKIKEGADYLDSDGRIIKLSARPYISDSGMLMVPLREMSESIDVDLVWNAEEKNVQLSKGQRIIIFRPGMNTAILNGNAENLHCSPQIIDGKIFVSVRDFAELVMGVKDIAWNDTDKTVAIYYND